MGRNTQLSTHFKLSEFVREIDPLPPEKILDNLKALAFTLERVRATFGGRPVRINSGYRTKEHNKEVGGKSNSYHLKGMAADIVVEGVQPETVQKALNYWPGGLGSYPTFTHVDIRPYKARWAGK